MAATGEPYAVAAEAVDTERAVLAQPPKVRMVAFVEARIKEDLAAAERLGTFEATRSALDAVDRQTRALDDFRRTGDEVTLRALAAEWSGHADYQAADWSPASS